MDIRGSSNLYGFIKRHEGFRSKPYDDFGGTAVGYGDTSNTSGPVTEAEASRRLAERVALAEKELGERITNPNLSQQHKDVLIDAHYNRGIGNMGSLIDAINKNDMASARSILSTYTKATNKKTGILEEVPGLIRGTGDRLNIWDSASGFTNASVDDEVRLAISDYERADSGDAVLDAINTYEKDTAAIAGISPSELRKQSIEDAARSSDVETALKIQQAQRISKETGKDIDSVLADLYDRDAKDVMRDHQAGMIADYFPAVAKWGPENYVMFKESGDWPLKTEALTRGLSKEKYDNLQKTIQGNILPFVRAKIHFDMVRGAITSAQAAEMFRNADAEQQKYAITEPGMKEIAEAKGWDSIIAMAQHPKAAGLTAAQSISSSVAPTALIVGGALAPVPGSTAAGLLSGMTMIHLLSFSESMDNDLQEFKNPETGEIDYDAALSDPVRLRKWQRQADVFAFAMTSVEGAFGGLVGKIFKKFAPKTALKKVAKGAAVAATEIVGEGVSQTSAITSKEIYKGTLTTDKFKEAVDEGIKEAGIATISIGALSGAGTTISIAGGGAKKLIQKKKHAARKTVDKAIEASKANEDATVIQSIRQNNQESPTTEQYPEEAGELVNTVLTPEPPQSEVDFNTDIDAVTDDKIKELEREADLNVVRITPSEWFAYHESKGADPTEILRNFPPNIQQEFTRNTESDTPVSIPIGDWIEYSKNDPELDAIVRVNGNEFNAIEGNEVLEELDKNTEAYLSESQIPPIPIAEYNDYNSRYSDYTRPYKNTPNNLLGIAGEGRRSKSFDESNYKYVLPVSVVQQDGSEHVDLIKGLNKHHAFEIAIRSWPWAQVFPLAADSKGTAFREVAEGVFETSKELEDALDKVTGEAIYFSESQIPPIPEGDRPMTIIEATDAEGNLVSRPVELTSKFVDAEDKEVYRHIHSKMTALNETLDQKLEPEAINTIADLQYRHLKHRANMLGVPVKELSDMVDYGVTKKKDQATASGVFYSNRIFGLPSTVTVNRNADISTFMHELGHSWLHEMSEDSAFINGIAEDKLTPEQREYKEAMQTVAEEYGLKDIGEFKNLDEESRKAVNESFAQTAEKYFLDGEFTGVRAKMRNALESFRKWFLHIAELVGTVYPQYKPLQINPKIERVFESILNLSNRAEDEVYPMFRDPLFDPDMLGKNKDKYIDAIKDARSYAIGEAISRIAHKSIREREKLIDAATDRIYQEAANEVGSRPAMLLHDMFKEMYADAKKNDQPEPRFSFNSITKVLANGDVALASKIKDSVPREFIAGKKHGGSDVKVFMEVNGITDPKQLLDMMTEAAQREAMIEELAKKKINEEFPLLKSDEDIHNEAVKAVNNAGMSKLLHKEFDTLLDMFRGTAKKLIETVALPPKFMSPNIKKDIKNKAYLNVMSTSYKGFSPNTFLKASLQAGRQAARMLKSNNIIEALDAKYKEIELFKSYEMAKGAATLVAKTRLYVEGFSNVSKTKGIYKSHDYYVMQYGVMVIEAASKGIDIPHMDYTKFPEYTSVTDSMQQEINKRIDKLNAAIKGRKGENNMTVEAFISLGDVLKAVKRQAKDAKTLYDSGGKALLEEVIDVTAEKIADGPVVQFDQTTVAGITRAALVNMETLLSSLFKDRTEFIASPLGRKYYEVLDGEAQVVIKYSEYKNRLSDVARKAYEVTKSKGLKGVYEPIVHRYDNVKSLFFPSNENKIEFVMNGNTLDFIRSKGDLLMAIALMGSESGAKKLLYGYKIAIPDFHGDVAKISKEDLQAWNDTIEDQIAKGNLIKEDFDIIQEYWNIFEEIHPLVNESIIATNGYPIGNIKGWEVKNSLGTWKGGYVPVENADFQSPKIVDEISVDTPGYEWWVLYPTLRPTMANERSDAYYPVSLDFNRLLHRVQIALSVGHIRRPLIEFGRMIEHPKMKAIIEYRRPESMYGNWGVMANWFRAVNGQVYTEPSHAVHEKIARHMKENMNRIMYFLRLLTGPKQYLGLFPTGEQVGFLNTGMAGMSTAVSLFTTIDRIKNESSVMAARFRGAQKLAVKEWDNLNKNFDWISESNAAVEFAQWALIHTAQMHVDIITYEAAKKKALKEGMSNKDAINYAASIVNATQASPFVSGMANIQRGKNTWKLIIQATTHRITMNNLMREAAMRDPRVIPRSAAVISVALAAVAMPSFLTALMYAKMRETGYEEKDEEKDERERISLRNRIFLGDVAEAVVPVPLVGMNYPIFDIITQSAPKAYKGLERKMEGVDMSDEEVIALMKLFTLVTGIPASTIAEKGTALNDALLTEEELLDKGRERRLQLKELRSRQQEE